MQTPSIFINLPVTSLEKAEPFYEALGFKKNPMFSSSDTTGMVFSDTIHLMIMEHHRFQSFMPANKTLVSGRDATETLLCLMVAKKEDVDKMIEGGGSKGGKVDPTKLPEMEGHYGRSVEDPDGHIWEIGCFTMSKGCTDASKECADLPKGD